MAAVEPRTQELDDPAIFEWRLEVLMRAGYLPNQAWTLAARKDVDVRMAERLLAEGCPPATAVRILF
jgi:hypothetical protein